MNKKPEPYTEEEKRLAKIHQCHPQNIRDFNAFIQHTRKIHASILLVVPKPEPEQIKEKMKKLLGYKPTSPNYIDGFIDGYNLRQKELVLEKAQREEKTENQESKRRDS